MQAELDISVFHNDQDGTAGVRNVIGCDRQGAICRGRAEGMNNEAMKLAAAIAIAELIAEGDLRREYIIPSVFDKQVAEAVE